MMARPKETLILSEAFEQRCQREKEKLKLEIKRNLKEDIIRLLTEEIHPDVNITDGVDVVPSHLFILKARAKRLFEILKIDSDKCNSMDKINIPWLKCRKLEEFVKQLYYTENVNSLIDEIEDTLNNETPKNKDDLNHNSCYTNLEKTVNLIPESNTLKTSEIHLSDVCLEEKVNMVEHLNDKTVSISKCGNGESRNNETDCEGVKENNSIADNNVSTSEIDNNVLASGIDNNVLKPEKDNNGLTSEIDNNVLRSEIDNNGSTSEIDNNGLTSEIGNNVLRSEKDNNLLTSVIDNNILTSEIDNNVLTSKMDNNVLISEIDNNLLTSKIDNSVLTSEKDNNVLISEIDNNVLISEIDNNGSTSVADNNLPIEVVDVKMLTSVADDTNLPELIKLSYGLSLPHQCCSNLGEDLLRAFLQEICCDCSLVVAGQQFKAHKCILAARSDYFEAMLGGQWRESDSKTIELEGISPEAVEQALLFLYGGVIDVIETCNIPDLLVVGDMYGMKGLKHVSAFLITKDYCHFFHKPCSSCLSLAGDALTLAVTYNLHDLQEKCVKWINKYFTKFWSSRYFACQHEDILTLCCDQLISQISEQNVVDMIMDSHKLQGNIPHVKWAEPILHLTSQLMTATTQFISNNFISIMGSRQFLGWEKGAAWNLSVLKDIFGQVLESVSASNGCKIYQALLRLDEYNESFEDSTGREDLHEFIKYLLKKCETFLRINIHQVTLTKDWSVLPENIRNKILSCASYVCFDSGNNMTRKRPPKLNSSRKTYKPGAVIQSLRDDHETNCNKNGTNSRKLNTNPGSRTKSKQIPNKTPAATNYSISPTSHQYKHAESGNKNIKVAKKDGLKPNDEEDVTVNSLLSVSLVEDTLPSVKNVRLKPVSSQNRQMSWSPDSDRIPSPSNISPGTTTKIPIFRSSSLSPFQERSISRSPEAHPYVTSNPSELSTPLKMQGECNPFEEMNGIANGKPWVKSSVSATEAAQAVEELSVTKSIDANKRLLAAQSSQVREADDLVCITSRSNVRVDEARLLPLFEVIFHKPSQ